jgi:hypothetical protein
MLTMCHLLQEVRMRQGNKKIYHLEAWVVKVMSIYKVGPFVLTVLLEQPLITAQRHSISSTILIWGRSIERRLD